MSNTKLVIKSPNFNHIFDRETGFSATWGKTLDDDPDYSPFGPLLLDIEISTICSKGCKACYKSNTSNGKNMNLDTFKLLASKLPKTVGQIAFGIGDIDGNPDLWNILAYCREINIVPNITINGARMKPEYYDNLVKYCGAVAVSHYSDDECFNAVKELTDRGLKQVNIHQILSQNTLEECFSLLEKYKTDERLGKLRAIVFLTLKPKGNRNVLEMVYNYNDYKKLIDKALDENIPVGFDSCGGPLFSQAIKGRSNYNSLMNLVEPCESMLFSLYFSVDGIAYPCSFAEGNYKGVNIRDVNDFLKDLWFAKEFVDFRNKSIASKDCNGCRNCVEFDLRLGGSLCK